MLASFKFEQDSYPLLSGSDKKVSVLSNLSPLPNDGAEAMSNNKRGALVGQLLYGVLEHRRETPLAKQCINQSMLTRNPTTCSSVGVSAEQFINQSRLTRSPTTCSSVRANYRIFSINADKKTRPRVHQLGPITAFQQNNSSINQCWRSGKRRHICQGGGGGSA